MFLGYRLSILPQKEQTKFAKQTYVGRPGFQGLVAYSPILGLKFQHLWQAILLFKVVLATGRIIFPPLLRSTGISCEAQVNQMCVAWPAKTMTWVIAWCRGVQWLNEQPFWWRKSCTVCNMFVVGCLGLTLMCTGQETQMSWNQA